MSIAVACPACAASFNAPDAAAGKRVKCPKCQQPFGVVSAASPSIAPAVPGIWRLVPWMLAASLVLLTALVSLSVVNLARGTPAQGQQWEYRTEVFLRYNLDDQLNAFGRGWWQVISIQSVPVRNDSGGVNPGYEVVFKRPL